MKLMYLTLAPWKWDGYVLVGGTSAELIVWVKKTLGAELSSGAHAAGHAYVEYGQPWVLWVESLKDVAALAHEAFHVAAGVLEGRGLTHTGASEEAYTYTMEHIMRAALTNRTWKKAA